MSSGAWLRLADFSDASCAAWANYQSTSAYRSIPSGSRRAQRGLFECVFAITSILARRIVGYYAGAISYYGDMRFLAVCLLAVLPCAAQQSLYPFVVDQDRLSGAPDFSFLNQPITPKDRVMVRNDKFVRAADGSPVRFFGVNLALGASFPEPQDAARIAKRLRRLGCQPRAVAPHGHLALSHFWRHAYQVAGSGRYLGSVVTRNGHAGGDGRSW